MGPERSRDDRFAYVGRELDLFSSARNWKAYVAAVLRPYLVGDVLEVGAGIGASTRALAPSSPARSWTCLEPDIELVARLRREMDRAPVGIPVAVREGTLASLPDDANYDAILYLDVLEHIEDDRAEATCAASRLRPGGRLVVLAPSHNFLFSPFDRAIGHFRRYDRHMFRALSPEGLVSLAAAGMVLSLGNRLLLRRSMPTAAQVEFWDRRVVPVSRVLDLLLFRRVGKSIVGIWRKPLPDSPLRDGSRIGKL